MFFLAETLYVFSFLHERVVCASSLHWNRLQDTCAMERKDGIFLIFVLLHFISKIRKIYRGKIGITVEVFTHLLRAGQTKVSMPMCFNHYDTNVVIQFYGTFFQHLSTLLPVDINKLKIAILLI